MLNVVLLEQEGLGMLTCCVHFHFAQAYHPEQSMPVLGFGLIRLNLGPMVCAMHLVHFVGLPLELTILKDQNCHTDDAGPDSWLLWRWPSLRALLAWLCPATC